MATEAKRKRASNMRDGERAVLSDLAIRFAEVIDSRPKRTDAVTVRQKELAWQQLAVAEARLGRGRWGKTKHFL